MPDARLSSGNDVLHLVDLLRDPRHYLLIQLDDEPDSQQLVTAYALADRVPGEFGEWVRTLIVAGSTAAKSLRELEEFDVSLLTDQHGEFCQRFGAGAGLWVMRPDGHLAFRASLSDADQLLDWLRNFRRR